MYQILKQRTEGAAKAAVELTQNLIRIPSLSRAERGVSEEVFRAMSTSGAFDQVLRDDVGNVVGVQLGTESGPTVLLLSHQDTVVAAEPGEWTHAPYSGVVSEDCVWGLGAVDCKGGTAAHIAAALVLRRSLLPLRGALVVAATVAEENGVGLGVRHLITKTLPDLDLRPEFAILAEPTNRGVYFGHDGWVQANIQVEARDLFTVVDASEAIQRDLQRAALTNQVPGSRETLAVGAPRVVGVNGRSHALVPVQRRIHRGESLSETLQQLQAQAAASARPSGAVGVELELGEEEHELYTGVRRTAKLVSLPWTTDPFSTLPRRVYQSLGAAECHRKTGEWTLSRLGMGTAGGTLVNDFAIPTVGYGPGDEELAHARDERVELSSLTEVIYGTAAIAHGLIGVPVYGWSADDI